jgi:HD-GYP domain-containing protein (c-di-GMP phosphodiesterase class II)
MLADLTEAVETRHPWTRGHAHRVAALAVAVAQSLGWDDQALSDVRAGSLLHDIGKLSIPGEILAKARPLNAVEQAEVRRHPASGRAARRNLPRARRRAAVDPAPPRALGRAAATPPASPAPTSLRRRGSSRSPTRTTR